MKHSQIIGNQLEIDDNMEATVRPLLHRHHTVKAMEATGRPPLHRHHTVKAMEAMVARHHPFNPRLMESTTATVQLRLLQFPTVEVDTDEMESLCNI